MPVTININNLTLCHKGSSGVTMATLPDVCKSPSIPVPYPNIAFSSDLKKGTTTIDADGGNMCAKYGSEFFKSTGDEAGVGGGIKSGKFTKEATWITYSFDVKLEGKGACRLTDKMFHNHQNTVNAAGEFQGVVGAVGLDRTMQALCEIFCKVKKEGMDSKRRNPKGRFDYSKRAADLAEKHPGLKGLSFEKRMFAAIDNLSKRGKNIINLAKRAGRKVWGASAIKNRLLKQFAKKAGVQVAKKAAKKAFLKFIPVVNVVSLAWDAYDVASLGLEAYNLVSDAMQAYDPAKVTTFEIRPDVAKVNPDGTVSEIYDFKFDRPAMTADDGTKLPKYQDTMSQDQRALYDEKLRQSGSRSKAKEINQDRCQCK